MEMVQAQPIKPRWKESRVFPIIVTVVLLVLFETLPDRYEILPRRVGNLLELLLVASMVVAGLSRPTSKWAIVERWVIWVIAGITLILTVGVLRNLIEDILLKTHHVAPISLLTTAVALWVVNILVFALVYWQLDRGGPRGKAIGWKGRADFTFPETDPSPSDGIPADWQPRFADYLFISFNTSTAFSPAEVFPLTPRAKLLMIAQSSMSLVVIVIIAARAINLLT